MQEKQECSGFHLLEHMAPGSIRCFADIYRGITMYEKQKMTDEQLDRVSGGTGNVKYTDEELKKAGVIISRSRGNTLYQVRRSDGRVENINMNVAMGMCDCYELSGGTRLTDRQLDDLIAQS